MVYSRSIRAAWHVTMALWLDQGTNGWFHYEKANLRYARWLTGSRNNFLAGTTNLSRRLIA